MIGFLTIISAETKFIFNEDFVLGSVVNKLGTRILNHRYYCYVVVFVPCLSQDMDPISDMSYSNQAVPVESRILDVPERPVTGGRAIL